MIGPLISAQNFDWLSQCPIGVRSYASVRFILMINRGIVDQSEEIVILMIRVRIMSRVSFPIERALLWNLDRWTSGAHARAVAAKGSRCEQCPVCSGRARGRTTATAQTKRSQCKSECVVVKCATGQVALRWTQLMPFLSYISPSIITTEALFSSQAKPLGILNLPLQITMVW